MILSLLCGALALTPLVVGTVTNITVPYNDSSVTRTGSWMLGSNDCGGVLGATSNENATVTILFNGTAIYLLTSGAIGANIDVYLDGGNAQVISDYGKNCGQVIYSNTGFKNMQHNLTCESSSGITLDSFIVTTDNTTATPSSSTLPGPTTTGVGSTSPASHSKTAIIIGSVIGGLVVLVVLGILIYYLSPPSLPPKEPTFIFRSPPLNSQEKPERIQITFVITFKDTERFNGANRSDKQKVVWRVFDIGGQEEHSFKLPYDLAFGFGTVTKDTFKTDKFECALPNCLLALKADDDLSWEARTIPDRNLDKGVQAKNETDRPRLISLGSYTATKSKKTFYPFLLINDFLPDTIYTASQDLMLHAYRTQDCKEGQVLTDESMLTESLFTGQEGVEILKLQPLTNWRLGTSGDEGKLKLEEDPNPPINDHGRSSRHRSMMRRRNDIP